MLVIFDRGYSIPQNLRSVDPNSSPTLLLDAQGLAADASALKHMPNANLLIVEAILIDRDLRTIGKSA